MTRKREKDGQNAMQNKKDGTANIKDVLLFHGLNIDSSDQDIDLFSQTTTKSKIIKINPEATL